MPLTVLAEVHSTRTDGSQGRPDGRQEGHCCSHDGQTWLTRGLLVEIPPFGRIAAP
jgi:hypothetical protein